jgi:hypothetical protein
MIVAASALVLLLAPDAAAPMVAWRAGVGVALPTLVSDAGQVAQSDQSLQAFVISIGGSASTRVVAACLVSRGADAEVVSLEGALPQRREFEATGLSCQIKKLSGGGALAVEISKNGRVVSRQVSSGSTAVLSISVQ